MKGYGKATHLSLKAKLIIYFVLNPEESLTVSDIVLKYGVSKYSVRYAIVGLRAAGMVEVSHVKVGPHKPVLLVSAGPELLKMVQMAKGVV